MKRSCTHVLGNLWTIGWLGKTLFPTCIPSENFLRWNTWASLSIIPCLFANNVVGNDEDNRPVQSSLKLLGIMVQEDLRWGQVALMTKKASRKIWVMRRVKMKMKNVGLDGKNYLRFFLKAEGQILWYLFFICPRQLNNWHCMSLLWDFLRHFFDLNGWLTVREWLGRH